MEIVPKFIYINTWVSYNLMWYLYYTYIIYHTIIKKIIYYKNTYEILNFNQNKEELILWMEM